MCFEGIPAALLVEEAVVFAEVLRLFVVAIVLAFHGLTRSRSRSRPQPTKVFMRDITTI